MCREFANDVLTLPELERRLARAREAGTPEDLRALLADLTPLSAPVPAPPDATRTTPTRSREGTGERRRGSHVAFAVMGGTRRAGKWTPPGNMLAIAIMGGVELDFRDAVLTPGVTEINVFAFWGGVEITVPPDVHVDTHGLAIMGGFEQAAELESDPPPDAPTIRVNGVAI
ncbi:MAG TPA: LiaF domain-containing protein, partial [Longimicrobiales bacterium]|nr:LiaF domain-containing protein [Longimicrobiales bacterium]